MTTKASVTLLFDSQTTGEADITSLTFTSYVCPRDTSRIKSRSVKTPTGFLFSTTTTDPILFSSISQASVHIQCCRPAAPSRPVVSLFSQFPLWDIPERGSLYAPEMRNCEDSIFILCEDGKRQRRLVRYKQIDPVRLAKCQRHSFRSASDAHTALPRYISGFPSYAEKSSSIFTGDPP